MAQLVNSVSKTKRFALNNPLKDNRESELSASIANYEVKNLFFNLDHFLFDCLKRSI